jgi:hypothetical protein
MTLKKGGLRIRPKQPTAASTALPEVADEHNVAALIAFREQQLLAVA